MYFFILNIKKKKNYLDSLITISLTILTSLLWLLATNNSSLSFLLSLPPLNIPLPLYDTAGLSFCPFLPTSSHHQFKVELCVHPEATPGATSALSWEHLTGADCTHRDVNASNECWFSPKLEWGLNYQ